MATFQIRVWPVSFESYEAAVASGDGSTFVGKSAQFDNGTGGLPGSVSPVLAALIFDDFDFSPAPEPSVLTMGFFGATGVIPFRLRRNR